MQFTLHKRNYFFSDCILKNENTSLKKSLTYDSKDLETLLRFTQSGTPCRGRRSSSCSLTHIISARLYRHQSHAESTPRRRLSSSSDSHEGARGRGGIISSASAGKYIKKEIKCGIQVEMTHTPPPFFALASIPTIPAPLYGNSGTWNLYLRPPPLQVAQ